MAERRFPAPWKVVETEGGYRVDDAAGQTIGWWYGEDEPSPRGGHARPDAGKGLADSQKAFARLPEILAKDPTRAQ